MIESVRRPAPAPGVRLTRRGRVVVVVLAVALVLAAFWPTAGGGAGAEGGDRGGVAVAAVRGGVLPTPEIVVVGRHDTLWGIASRGRPGVDPRITVERIIALNGLRGAIVQPGERLRLPPR